MQEAEKVCGVTIKDRMACWVVCDRCVGILRVCLSIYDKRKRGIPLDKTEPIYFRPNGSKPPVGNGTRGRLELWFHSTFAEVLLDGVARQPVGARNAQPRMTPKNPMSITLYLTEQKHQGNVFTWVNPQ